MDSQSDWSTNPDFSPTFRRRTLISLSSPESDSDTESLRQLLNSSRDQLNYTKNIYHRQVSLGINEYLVTNEIVSFLFVFSGVLLFKFKDEMISTCDRHFDLLTNVEKKSDELAISKIDKGIVAGRNWFSSRFPYTWRSLFSFLLRKLLGFVVYLFFKIVRMIQ